MIGFRVPDPPPSAVMEFDEPFPLEGGGRLDGLHLAFRTWGTLAPRRDNAILLTHALTGDQFAAGTHPVTGEAGWWDFMIGPNRPLDPDRDFLICANCLGGSMGSTGPQTVDRRAGRRHGARFPNLTIADMVRAQLLLLDRLGITRLRLVVGGSMGGMQALELLRLAPERIGAVAAFAIGARHHARQIAFHALQRRAIMEDPDWHGGDYLEAGRAPVRGLSLARMIAHMSYRAAGEMEERFGRHIRRAAGETLSAPPLYEIESYLLHHGEKLVERFDANSYLVITTAMDSYSLGAPGDELRRALAGAAGRPAFLASYDSDWLYPPTEIAELAGGLEAAGVRVVHHRFTSRQGHDSFLLPLPEPMRAFAEFVASLRHDAIA